jgi:hypothetical protein
MFKHVGPLKPIHTIRRSQQFRKQSVRIGLRERTESSPGSQIRKNFSTSAEKAPAGGNKSEFAETLKTENRGEKKRNKSMGRNVYQW